MRLVLHLLVWGYVEQLQFIEALDLAPTINQWVRLGQENVTFVCKSSMKIKSCTWTTPYGKTYPLATGLMTEHGRLKHHAEDNNSNKTIDNNTECGVVIRKVEVPCSLANKGHQSRKKIRR